MLSCHICRVYGKTNPKFGVQWGLGVGSNFGGFLGDGLKVWKLQAIIAQCCDDEILCFWSC
jgi:hypothetical protein